MTTVQTPPVDAAAEETAMSKLAARIKRIVSSNPSVLPTLAAIVIFVVMVIPCWRMSCGEARFSARKAGSRRRGTGPGCRRPARD